MKIKLLPYFASLLTMVAAATPDPCSYTHNPGFHPINDGTGDARLISVPDAEGVIYHRTYAVLIPPDYGKTKSRKWPLIFDFHGRKSNAANQYKNSQYDKATNGAGDNYVVVYPEGYKRKVNDTERSWGIRTDPPSGPPDDIEFVRLLLQEMKKLYCIDPTAVYASGKSIGGGFVDTLACSDVGDSFAAFAMAAAALYNDTDPGQVKNAFTCKKKRAILEAHGFEDSTANYTGRQNKEGGPLPNIKSWVDRWVDRTCPSSNPYTVKKTLNSLPATDYLTYNYSCSGYTSVVYHYNITNGGHCWPSKDASNFDAEGKPECDMDSLDFTDRVLKHFARWTTNTAPKN